jgi:AmmeMemoRadiSam system protein B
VTAPHALTARHHPACYPTDPDKTLEFFQEAFTCYPEAELASAPSLGKLAGVVTPHIDFRVSLPSYSAAFQPLLHVPLADVYLILGVGHRSRLEWNLDRRDYVTPLGRAECAADLVDALADGTPPERRFLAAAHEGEHSIEFPLLWLQALHRLHPKEGAAEKPVRFIPVLCGALHAYVEGMLDWSELADFHRLSETLADLFTKMPPASGKLHVIVSIDGCHLGPRFQHPFQVTPKLLKSIATWEQELWNHVAQGDAKKFLAWMCHEGNDRYFDGVGALALLLNAGNLAGGKPFVIQRTYYEQWFTDRDHSAVTFSSGRVLI